MKGPVPYFGSKQSVAPWIVSLLPEHEHYVEPFCGGLSVLFDKRPSRMETVNDLDGELMTFWRVLRDQPEQLIRACMLTPHSRAELTATWDPTDDDLELARRIWCRLAQGRSGTLRNTGWRHYIDPPYHGTTRGWGNNYRPELKTELEHRELAAALADCKAAVVLSGYASPLYDELYDGWHRAEQQTMTGNAKTDKARTEVLWANQPLGDQLDLFAAETA